MRSLFLLTRYKVLISKTAIKQLESLDRDARERIKTALRELEMSPFDPRPKADIKKLQKITKHVLYRLRVGNYRIVYSVENTDVKVAKIFKRELGYEWLD